VSAVRADRSYAKPVSRMVEELEVVEEEA